MARSSASELAALARAYEATTCLQDGEPLLIRAIRPDDKQALRDGLKRASPASAYHRFFQPKHDLSDKELVYFTDVDFEHHVALVAIIATTRKYAGVGRYVVLEDAPGKVAEIAFAVDDEYHGRGIATLLLQHLTEIGRAAGLSEFQATVLADNESMLSVLSRSELPMRQQTQGDLVEIRLILAGAG